MPYCLCPCRTDWAKKWKYLSSVHSHGGEGKIERNTWNSALGDNDIIFQAFQV